ncbi:MAG TPA: S8 family peptidase [Micropepsaceae bacterium]|nr:S8 family peptidase [Micropepsaceae bacterium]
MRATVFAAGALCLSACATGSSSGTFPNPQIPTATPSTTGTPIPPTANPNSFRTATYLRIGVLDAVHAADAYSLGYTGQGVTIGIIDFNFVFSSNQVNFAPGSVGPNAAMQALYAAQTGSTPSADQHGQAVAITAAGNGNGGIQGLAFNSRVLGVDFFSDVNESQVTQGGVLYHVSDPWTYITSHGVRIINTSFGYEASDIIPASKQPQVSQAYVLASGATAVQNGALLVASAGNGGGSQPSQSNIDTISDLQSLGILNSGPGAFIIAGAVDQNNQIASFSDRAGSYAAYYMVAPGVNLVLPWDGQLALVSGTSFSAPLISAAAAIIMQRWPNLTARQVADVLEQSATPLGDPTIYGYGMLNVYAALQPIGTTTVAVATGIAPTVTSSALLLGPVFGDAPMLHAALAQVMILDSFGRDFETDMSKAIVAQPTLPDLFGVMEQRFGWHGGGFDLGPNSFASFNVRSNPEDGILPLQSSGGLAGQLQHQSTFRLMGEQDGIFWMAGSGMSLRQGMMPARDDPFVSGSITNGFLPLISSPVGNFAAAGFALSDSTKLTFGIGEAQNQGLPNISLPYRNDSELASLRLDYQEPGWRFSFDAGSSFDTGAFFGSLASGSLRMANEETTTWMTGTGELDLNRTWTFKGTATLAVAGAVHPEASLITSIGPVLASSFAFGLAGRDIFTDGDVMLFTVSQPMRAEYGVATLSTGIGRDWSTGGVIMGQAQASLAPSGREIDLESGYGLSLGDWRLQANAGFALNEDHTRGKNALLSLVTLSHQL